MWDCNVDVLTYRKQRTSLSVSENRRDQSQPNPRERTREIWKICNAQIWNVLGRRRIVPMYPIQCIRSCTFDAPIEQTDKECANE